MRRNREARSKPVRPAPPAPHPPQRPRRSVPSKVVENETAAAATQPGWEASAPQPQFPAGGGGRPSPTPSRSEQGLPAGADAQRRGSEFLGSGGPGAQGHSSGRGKGQRRRKAPKLTPGSTGFGRADPGGLERPHRGPGDPRTRGAAEVPGSDGPTPVGSRGAATSRRVCPGARREGGGGAEGAGSQAAPSPGPPGRRPPPSRLFGPVALAAPAAPAPHLLSQLRRTPQASHSAPTGRTPPRRLWRLSL